MKTSKKNVSFTDLFSMGSFDEYNFNEKVETCFMRLSIHIRLGREC